MSTGRPGDDGSAEPRVAAALDAYAAGHGGEHALLLVLAGSRLLVPVVATLAGPPGEDGKGSEMVLPSVVGNDGRTALLAFTSLASLTRWRPDARPVPAPAASVWQAGAQEASAVVLDIAGPVPVAVDGARLAALAGGRPVPPPHEDPDVAALAQAALAAEPAITGFRLTPAGPGSDLSIEVSLAAGQAPADPAVQGALGRAVGAIMAGAGMTLRRGIVVTLAGQ